MFDKIRQRFTHIMRTASSELTWSAGAVLAVTGIMAAIAVVTASGPLLGAAALAAGAEVLTHHLTGAGLVTFIQHTGMVAAFRGLFSRHHTAKSSAAEQLVEPDDACADDIAKERVTKGEEPAKGAEAQVKPAASTNSLEVPLASSFAFSGAENAHGWRSQLDKAAPEGFGATELDRSAVRETVGVSR